MKKFLSVLFILVFAMLCLASCEISLGNPSDSDNKDTTYQVMVVETPGVEITSENPIRVKKGADAEFDITVGNTYLIIDVTGGEYDPATGKITVKNVKKDVRVSINAQDMGYDVTKTYGYFFRGGEFDTTSVANSSALRIGTKITVVAGDADQYFVGWSIGGKIANGGQLVSNERTFTFDVGPDFSVNGSSINLFSNYANTNIYYYDANGGKINTNTPNIANKTYYTATVTGSKVTVKMEEKYFNYAVAASSFWDDGTFTRDGYVLKEYNTKADGTGESYSLGSKYYADYAKSSSPTLYCIWEKETDQSAFVVADLNMPYPTVKNGDKTVENIHKDRKSRWMQSGVVITQYTGNDTKVVIPEKINGKTVIAIAKDAFKNKDVTTLVLSRFIQKMEDGAFVNCSKLSTIVYPDSIYYVSDAVLDKASYTSFKHFYVNATMAPGFVSSGNGAFAVKLCRILSTQDKNRIIVVAGSSTFQGLASEYMENLFDNEYEVVNFGTTRVCTGVMYLEAFQHYLHEGDIAILSPENHIRMMGDTQIFSSVIRDTQGMNNVYRYIDISNYENVFTGFAEFNQNLNYKESPKRYEAICDDNITKNINKYGDYINANRQAYCGETGVKFVDTYYISMNNRFKSRYDGVWNDAAAQEQNKDYKDPNNVTWCNVDDPKYVNQVNRIIKAVQATGADVCFGFCPTDASRIVSEAQNVTWLANFDKMFKDNYEFDAVLGSCMDYIYDHKYFYDCAYHVNDYGRTYRTYQLYLDICEFKGITATKKIDAKGTNFEGCLFEKNSDGTPLTKVGYLSAK